MRRHNINSMSSMKKVKSAEIREEYEKVKKYHRRSQLGETCGNSDSRH